MGISKIIMKVIALVMALIFIIPTIKQKESMDTKTYLDSLIQGYFWFTIAFLYD